MYVCVWCVWEGKKRKKINRRKSGAAQLHREKSAQWWRVWWIVGIGKKRYIFVCVANVVQKKSKKKKDNK